MTRKPLSPDDAETAPTTSPKADNRHYAKTEAPPLPPLVYTRRQASQLLGSSIATVIRLERLGRLRAIKLSGRPTGATFYAADEVRRLSQIE